MMILTAITAWQYMLVLAGISTTSIGYKGTVTMGSGGLAYISNIYWPPESLPKPPTMGYSNGLKHTINFMGPLYRELLVYSNRL